MAPRRVAAVLLAVFLNLALVPCTMAVEVVGEGHDCCPPELRLDPSECCQIDVGSSDARTGAIKIDFDVHPGSGCTSMAELIADLLQGKTGSQQVPSTGMSQTMCTAPRNLNTEGINTRANDRAYTVRL